MTEGESRMTEGEERQKRKDAGSSIKNVEDDRGGSRG